MPLSADYIWQGFLGRPPHSRPGPRPSPHPGPAGALGFQALALSPGPGRSGPAGWAAAAAASPARPTPGWPSPRPGPAIGRGGWGAGEGGGRAGPGWGGGAGARLCGGSGPWRPGAAPSAPRSRLKGLFYAPRPSLGSGLGKEGIFFFWKSPPTTRGEGFGAGLQSRRRLQGPRGAPRPAHASQEPWKAQARGAPLAPPEAAAAVSLPFFFPAWHPSPGPGQGPRQVGAQAPGTEGGAGWLPGGWVATREGRWRRGKRATLPGRSARRSSGRGSAAAARPPRRRGWAPPPLPTPLPGSGEGRVRRGGGMGARQHPSPP